LSGIGTRLCCRGFHPGRCFHCGSVAATTIATAATPAQGAQGAGEEENYDQEHCSRRTSREGRSAGLSSGQRGRDSCQAAFLLQQKHHQCLAYCLHASITTRRRQIVGSNLVRGGGGGVCSCSCWR